MKTFTFLVMLLLCLVLSATSMVIKREDQPDIAVPIATVDSIYFTDQAAGEVTHLQFVPAHADPGCPVEVAVQLLDAIGNPVLNTTPVHFSFVNMPPSGTNINHEVYTINDTLTVRSVYGMAIVSLNCGTESGVVWLSASVDLEDDTVSETCNYVIHATNVDNVSIQYGNDVTNAGSGCWSLPIGAMCTNDAGVPATYGTAVWFSIPDQEIDWCSVIPESYIGNPNVYGDSLPGMAYTRLCYDGAHSLEDVTVRIQVGDFDEAFMVELPLIQPQLDAVPIPGHLDWTEGSDWDYVEGEIQIHVSDGQGNPVHYAIVSLTSTHGEFVEPDVQYQVPGEDWSVIHTNTDGYTRGRIRFYEYECPPVDPPPNEVPVDLTIWLNGTDVTDQTTIILLNYNEPE